MDKELLTEAGFPRVLVVCAHEQPGQHDEQQGRQERDELHGTGRTAVKQVSLIRTQESLLRKTLSTLPCPKAQQQSVSAVPAAPPGHNPAALAQPCSGSQAALVAALPWLVLGCPQAQHLGSPLPASPSISSVSSSRALSANAGSC